MALKCAKNDFKHSMVHRDRRNENIFGCFFGPIFWDQKYVYVFCQKYFTPGVVINAYSAF